MMTDKPHHQKFEYIFLRANPWGASNTGEYSELIEMYKEFEKAGWEPVGTPTLSNKAWVLTIVRRILKDKTGDLSIGLRMCKGHKCPRFGNRYGIIEGIDDE